MIHVTRIGMIRIRRICSNQEAIDLQPGIVPHSNRGEWKRILLLVAVFAAIVLAVTLMTFFLFYSAALEEQGGRLLEIAQSQARIIEAIARHGQYPAEYDDTVFPSYLSILTDAHARYAIFGETGEFMIGQLEDGYITFLLSHRNYHLYYPDPVPIQSEWAEPMRQALLGESGTLIGLDYRGVVVLAAYEPVTDPDWGIVAKVDLSEVRAPFIKAALHGIGPVLAAIFLGALLFSRITRPIVRKIAEGQQRYQDLIETMQDGLRIHDEHGVIQYVNEQYCRILGRSRHQLIGTPTEQYMTAESKCRFAQQLIWRRQGIASSYECSFLRPDGSEVVTLVSPQPIVDEGCVFRGSFVTVSDITYLKEIECRLREEKDQAQRYLDIAGVMFVVLDENGQIALINRKGLEILNCTADCQLGGKNWFDTCIPSDIREAVRSVFSRIMSGEIEIHEYYENAVLTSDGQLRIISWHNTVLTDPHGNPIGTLSSGEDITEQRQAEQEKLALESQLQQAQKLESIGTLASGVAHEINNPLTGIINYAQLIHDRMENATLRDYAQGIIDEGNRVASIVKSLLSFSRQEKERHSPANMADIVNATVSLIRAVLHRDQIELTMDIPPDLPLLKCRTQQIQQVLLNLLTNARDALNDRYPQPHPDKTLHISVELIERKDGSWLRTIVEDHGSGISADIIDRIFDPFFSTKPREKGTGLGLSVSYGLVRDHHGRLEVESVPNAYTRFIMDLPVENGWKL